MAPQEVVEAAGPPPPRSLFLLRISDAEPTTCSCLDAPAQVHLCEPPNHEPTLLSHPTPGRDCA